MAFTTKLNLSNEKFEQTSGGTLTFLGINNFSGTTNIDASNFNIDGVNFSGFTGTTTTAANGLSVQSGNVVLGGTLTGDTTVDTNGNGIAFGGGNITSSACNSFAEGNSTYATGEYGSHAEGNYTRAAGDYGSHAEGTFSYAYGCASHVEGSNNRVGADGYAAHAEGQQTCAYGCASHAEGRDTKALGFASHSEGCRTTAYANFSHAGGGGFASGKDIIASGNSSFNHSYNSTAQVAGHGALAPQSVILGGLNHNIETGNTRAAIIGGNTIKLTGSSYVDNTVVSNLAIFSTPDDDATGDVLVWDSTSKKVGKRALASVDADNGLSVQSGTIVLGGTLTGDTTIDTTGAFTLTFDGQDVEYASDFSGSFTPRSLTDVGYVTGLTSVNAANIASNDADIAFISANTINDATNGLTKTGTDVELGGTLTQNTTIAGGGYSLSASDLTNATLSTTGAASVLEINAQTNGQAVIKSQSGTLAGDDFTNAVGFNLDFNADVFTIIDNRATATGIEYFADYSADYTDRSLVDKAYVDAVATGLDVKDSSNVATTANIDLTGGTFASGSTIDGVVVQDGWRVLAKNQTDGSENGIYVYSASTSGFTRSQDFDGNPAGEVTQGSFTFVITGDTQANTAWIVTTPDPITVGTTDIDFTVFTQPFDIVDGTGTTINIVGSNRQISVELAPDSGLDFDASSANGRLRVASSIAGDGLSFTSGVLAVTASTTVANGLSIDGDNVVLGGTLTGDTTVDTSGFGIAFGNATTSTGSNSFGQGICTEAIGDNSHAEGYYSRSCGINSHAEGNTTYAIGSNSHSEGISTRACGDNGSHSEGNSTIASGYSSHAEGYNTRAYANYSHAEGGATCAFGDYSHTEGSYTIATGDSSHAEGNSTCAIGANSHAEGRQTCAIGNSSHSEGQYTCAIGSYSHSEGYFTYACGENGSHAQGLGTQAFGNASHAGGRGTGSRLIFACGYASFNHSNNDGSQTAGHGANADFSAILGGINHNIESGNTGATIIGGNAIKLTGTSYADTTAVDNLAIFSTPDDGSGDDVLTWNSTTKKVGIATVAETTAANGLTKLGNNIVLGGSLTGDTVVSTTTFGMAFVGAESCACGASSFATGRKVCAIGNYSFASGDDNEAIGYASHAEGLNNEAIGDNSHAEGRDTCAIGNNSHAEGNNSHACGLSSHAEGCNTRACGSFSHSEGGSSIAIGDFSHAEGTATYACGNQSHSEGLETIATGVASHAEGTIAYANSNYSHAQGYRVITCGVASHSGGYGYAGSKNIYTCGVASFNHSRNTAAQTAGHGANADFSAILGGINHNIESGNTNAAIIGGNAIKLTGSSYVDHTAVDNLAIISTPALGTSSDTVLVRSSTTGIIRGIAGSELGEANNVYAITGITSATLTSNEYVVLVQTSGSSQTVILPSSPVDGQAYKIKDKGGNALTNAITVSGNGNNIDGAANATINTDYGALELVYSLSDDEWYSLAFIN